MTYHCLSSGPAPLPSGLHFLQAALARLPASMLLLCTVSLAAGCQWVAAPGLPGLIDRHTASRGGREAIETVQSVRFDLQISEPGFTVRGDYRANRDGFMRIDIYAGEERVFTEALGPDGGWQLLQAPAKPTRISQEGENILKRGLVGNLYGLHELQGLGYELSFAGRIIRDGQEFWAIDQTAPDGFSKRLFLDKSSYLVVRESEDSALHPDIDQTKTAQETRIDDYSVSNGVWFPGRSEKLDLASGEIIQTVIVKSVQVNPQIDYVIFNRPD